VSHQSCCAVPDWRTSTIAVEFHAYSAPVFLARVMPSLKQLSYSYKRLGGTLLTATVLREPIAHLFSTFAYYPNNWGPHPNNWGPQCSMGHRTCSIDLIREHFPTWAASPHLVGMQAGALVVTGNGRDTRCKSVHRHPCGCGGGLRSARRVLSAIDIVAPTECLAAFLATVDARLGLAAPAEGKHMAVPFRQPTQGAGTASVRKHITWSKFNHTTHELLRQVTECDRALYLEVIWRHAELTDTVECQLPALYEAVNTTQDTQPEPAEPAGKPAAASAGRLAMPRSTF